MAAGPLMASWLTEVVVVTYREVRQPNPAPGIPHLPMPSLYISTIIIYGGLGLLAESATFSGPAALIGWGVVVATLLNLWTPGGKSVATVPTTAQKG